MRSIVSRRLSSPQPCQRALGRPEHRGRGLGVQLVEEMVERGVEREAKAAWLGQLSTTARQVLGLEEFATLPLPEAVAAVVTATRRLARYQRKWLRRLPVAATLAADRRPEEIADEIVALAGAGQRLPGR